MPDLYDQIAGGSYGRSRDRWYSEPDFEAVTPEDDEDDFDGEDVFVELDELIDELL